ncbi:MAG: potassium channel family protein [Usitatibacter sp.]
MSLPPFTSQGAAPRARRDRIRVREASAEYRPRLFVSRPPPGRLLLRRLGMIFVAILAVVLIFWIERDNLRDSLDGSVGLVDVVYFAAITITTVGYGDIVPVGERARLVDAVVVTPIRVFIWLMFLGTAYELFWQRLLEERRMKRLQEDLVGHTIVCGYGYSGSSAARLLGTTEQERRKIVVIDRDADRLEEASACGFIGLRGDCTRDIVLQQASVDSAAAILFCIRRDKVAALAILTARNLNADIRILAMVKDQENVRLLQRAGAQEVIAPSRLAGYLMADAVRSRYTTRFVSDLLAGPSGFIHLVERVARPEEVGRGWRDFEAMLLIAVERAGRIVGFWEADARRIEQGDLLFAIESNPGASGRIEPAPPL